MTTRKSKDSLVSKIEKELLGEELTFGAAIEGLRGRDELSQVALAKKLGLSRQYICDIEKGRRLVSPEQAGRFAKAFGHPPTILVQLALQDSVRASGLKLKVSVEAA